MVNSEQLQATHCYEPPAWKGIRKDRMGRSHYVEAYAKHALKVKDAGPTARTPEYPASQSALLGVDLRAHDLFRTGTRATLSSSVATS
jgi:hypothetical protein